VIVGLDPIHDRLDVSLAERDLSAGDVFAHDAAEPGERFRVNVDRLCRRPDAVGCSLGALSVKFFGNPHPENVIKVRQAILNHFPL